MRSAHLTVDFYGSDATHITTHHVYLTDDGYFQTRLSVCRVFLLVHIRPNLFLKEEALIGQFGVFFSTLPTL